MLDEVAKIQPQISQSLSNLQMDSTMVAKRMIENTFAARKQIASSMNIPPVPAAVSEQIVRKSTEMTDNLIRGVATWNQLTINALDAARESVKIYNRTVDAGVDFYATIVKSWNPFWAWQQPQQFFRA